MISDLRKSIWKIIVILVLGGMALLSAFLEGYIDKISYSFMIFFAIVFLFCLWTATVTATRIFFFLIAFGFIIGYITQMIGTSSDLWSYHGIYGTYVFAAFAWAYAAVSMQGLSILMCKAIKEIDDKLLNIIAITVIFAIIPVALRTYKTDVELRFWIYYVTLFILAIVMSYRLSFSHLVSLILAAWIMGNISEYIGSHSGLWIFGSNGFPPIFLTFGCWPLEFLLQYNFADWMARGINET